LKQKVTEQLALITCLAFHKSRLYTFSCTPVCTVYVTVLYQHFHIIPFSIALSIATVCNIIEVLFELQCFLCHFSGPPSAPNISCVDLSPNGGGVMNVTVSWTLSGEDFYLINITTNAPQTPYGGLLNITTASVTQHELTGFMTDYEYNITVRGVNCGSQEGSESEPLTIPPQGIP